MSYEVLARKYRPALFAEVVGQDHILQALQNSLISGNLHQAFIFSGTRGVGKTTIARILAKALNCHNRGGIRTLRYLFGMRGNQIGSSFRIY